MKSRTVFWLVGLAFLFGLLGHWLIQVVFGAVVLVVMLILGAAAIIITSVLVVGALLYYDNKKRDKYNDPYQHPDKAASRCDF